MNKASDRIVIALDVMGGDKAPDAVLAGANKFAQSVADVSFLLFGKESLINSHMSNYPLLASRCQIHHADDVVDNKERASVAVRKGKNSSMRLAIESVHRKQAHAIVSGGNTGALMAMSKLILRTIPGIDRPAICSLFPTRNGRCIMLDLGANIDCNSDNLVQFAIMGDAFARVLLHKENPTIGLLNVGEEDTKGSEIVRAAAQEIREGGYRLNYHGYIEGNDIGNGIVDVVVTDGFTGNISVKTAEGTAKVCSDYMRQAFYSSPLAYIGGILARSSLKKAFREMDPRLHNGAMFLGLNGIAVKSHGSTDDIGFANAIKVAYELTKNNINHKISSQITQYDESSIAPNIDLYDEETSDGQ